MVLRDKEKASVRIANATPFRVSRQLASKGTGASRRRRAKTTLAPNQRSPCGESTADACRAALESGAPRSR
jgi:hypothetical protein